MTRNSDAGHDDEQSDDAPPVQCVCFTLLSGPVLLFAFLSVLNRILLCTSKVKHTRNACVELLNSIFGPSARGRVHAAECMGPGVYITVFKLMSCN